MPKARTINEIIQVRGGIHKSSKQKIIEKINKTKSGSLKRLQILKTCPNADQNMWRPSNPFLNSTCMTEKIAGGI